MKNASMSVVEAMQTSAREGQVVLVSFLPAQTELLKELAITYEPVVGGELLAIGINPDGEHWAIIVL